MSSPKTEPDQSQQAATTLDDFLGGRIKVAQPKQGHRAGSDAVLVAGGGARHNPGIRCSMQAPASAWLGSACLPAVLKFT